MTNDSTPFSSPSPSSLDTLQIGILIFPQATQLDFSGPHEVLTRVPNAVVHLVAKDRRPVVCSAGYTVLPSTDFADCPSLDVICVPGGIGQHHLMSDDETLDWVAHQGATARYVTAVCTGSLVLGAAGLLRGYRATTHWTSMEALHLVGATPVEERVVVDRNRITGGGVTAGIDFGLTLAAELAGEEAAKNIQLWLEYDPAPPFDAGHPRKAAPAAVERARMQSGGFAEKRRAAVAAAVARRGV
jgi:cyclohexyl-isocyanide hydratase